MDLIKKRIPSKRETMLLFIVCLLPVHIWAYVIFFYDVPGFILRMSLLEILRVLAYVQLVALGESIIFLMGIIFINMTLPARFFRTKFLPSSIVLMFITFVWIIPLHYQPSILESLDYNSRSYQIFILLWLLSYFGILLGAFLLVHRNQKIENMLSALPERLSVLAIIYLVFDMFGFSLLALQYLG